MFIYIITLACTRYGRKCAHATKIVHFYVADTPTFTNKCTTTCCANMRENKRPLRTTKPAAECFARHGAGVRGFERESGQICLPYAQCIVSTQSRNSGNRRFHPIFARIVRFLAFAGARRFRHPEAPNRRIWPQILLHMGIFQDSPARKSTAECPR